MTGPCHFSCPSYALLGHCLCAWLAPWGIEALGSTPGSFLFQAGEMSPSCGPFLPCLQSRAGKGRAPATRLPQGVRYGRLVARTYVPHSGSGVLMPARVRSTDDPAAPAHSPSFVCEVPLQVNSAQERILLALLEAARQVYNPFLGEEAGRLGGGAARPAFARRREFPARGPTP